MRTLELARQQIKLKRLDEPHIYIYATVRALASVCLCTRVRNLVSPKSKSARCLFVSWASIRICVYCVASGILALGARCHNMKLSANITIQSGLSLPVMYVF